MLIILGAVQGGALDFSWVAAFTVDVMWVFRVFSFVMLYINKNFLGNFRNVRKAFTVAGIISLVVGTYILIA